MRQLDRLSAAEEHAPGEPDVFDRPLPADEHEPLYDLFLGCGDLEVGLFVAEGPDAIAQLVRDAAPLVGTGIPAAEPCVLADDVPVVVHDDYVSVGARAFRIAEVRAYAGHGANIPITEHTRLQAALAMLAVAVHERDHGSAAPPLPADAVARFGGEFGIGNLSCTFAVEGDRLVLSSPDERQELVYRGADRFAMTAGGELRFVIGPDGIADRVEIDWPRDPRVIVWRTTIAPSAIPSEIAVRLVGDYEADNGPCAIVRVGDGLRLAYPDDRWLVLVLVDGVLRCRELEIEIRFAPGDDPVKSFELVFRGETLRVTRIG